MPDNVVYAPDCAKFDRRETCPVSAKELALQARTLNLSQYGTVVALAGRVYRDVLRKVFPRAEVKSPLSGIGGIGMMMRALTVAIKTQSPLT